MPRIRPPLVLLSLALATAAAPLAADSGVRSISDLAAADGADKSIDDVVFSATGRLFLSVDGGGSNAGPYGVQVRKPSASAKVRKAFLFAASTGLTNFRIPNGGSGIRLNGTGITWDRELKSSINSWNYRADVTSIVKPIVNPAGVGRTTFTLTEGQTALIDGTILAVVFDDPEQSRDSTVALLFGAQSTTGDAFSITLPNGINPNSRGALLEMGLGISYGAQASCAGGNQFSVIDVNGTRVTSSAGGEDDGYCQDGALITVGGLDDSNGNPANPNGGHGGNPRTDDELYSLLPFITSATRKIEIRTRNPSIDDNLFFAHFHISGNATVTPGSCAADDTTLCLDDRPGDKRFKATLSYDSTQNGGISGDAHAVSLASSGIDHGGVFWIFSVDNPEVLLKVLNACGVNDHFWVFYSAGTNLGFDLTVTDTKTGVVWRSHNRDLRLAPPVADVVAFDCP